MTARRSLAVVLVAVSILDAVTTWLILRAHQGRELNPIAAHAIEAVGPGAPAVARVVLGIVFTAVALRLTVVADGRVQQAAAWSLPVAALAWWATVAFGNLHYL